MSALYKLHYTATLVIRISSGDAMSYIPLDPHNNDYLEYVRWVAAGNTPDPADPAPVPSANEVADGADLASFPTRTQIANAIDQINADLGTLAGAPTNAQVIAIVSRSLNRELYEIKALKALVKHGAL